MLPLHHTPINLLGGGSQTHNLFPWKAHFHPNALTLHFGDSAGNWTPIFWWTVRNNKPLYDRAINFLAVWKGVEPSSGGRQPPILTVELPDRTFLYSVNWVSQPLVSPLRQESLNQNPQRGIIVISIRFAVRFATLCNMVRAEGFEPSTSSFQGRLTTRLWHALIKFWYSDRESNPDYCLERTMT